MQDLSFLDKNNNRVLIFQLQERKEIREAISKGKNDHIFNSSHIVLEGNETPKFAKVAAVASADIDLNLFKSHQKK